MWVMCRHQLREQLEGGCAEVRNELVRTLNNFKGLQIECEVQDGAERWKLAKMKSAQIIKDFIYHLKEFGLYPRETTEGLKVRK